MPLLALDNLTLENHGSSSRYGGAEDDAPAPGHKSGLTRKIWR